MNWTSIDIGNLMGVTHWEGQSRLQTLLVKPRGNKGAYYYGDKVVRSKCSAILHIIARSEFIIMERGMGARANVINGQAKIRGYIEGLCDLHKVSCKEVLPSEWRRPIKEHLGVSWPKRSIDQKVLAKQVVKKLYDLDVSEDEADSICIGWSALRLGYINLK